MEVATAKGIVGHIICWAMYKVHILAFLSIALTEKILAAFASMLVAMEIFAGWHKHA